MLEKFEEIEAHPYRQDNYSVTANKIEYQKFISYQSGLCEYLENKLFEVLDIDEIRIGKFIVGSLNEQGELTVDLEIIAEFF